jgi:hypothetical protein
MPSVFKLFLLRSLVSEMRPRNFARRSGLGTKWGFQAQTLEIFEAF